MAFAVSSRRAACSAAAILALANPASAFCRATTCDDSAGGCAKDAHHCLTDGEPLAWPGGKVLVWVDSAGSQLRKITSEQTAAAIAKAFAQWTNAKCEDTTAPEVDATVLSGADTPPPGVQGTVTFRDADWPYNPSFGALTQLTFDKDTGELFEARTEINSALQPLSLDPKAGEIDLDAVLTHEMGHVLGLAHSDVAGATMEPETRGFGSTDLASLDQDDEAGICAAYPVVAEEPGTNPSCSLGGPSSGGYAGSAMIAVAIGALRLRRRG